MENYQKLMEKEIQKFETEGNFAKANEKRKNKACH